METVTITGYRCSGSTLWSNPICTMMNENSPIWHKHIPDSIAFLRVWPEKSKPKVAANGLATIITAEMMRIWYQ